MVGIEAGSRTKGHRPEAGLEFNSIKVNMAVMVAETIAINTKTHLKYGVCNYLRFSIVE